MTRLVLLCVVVASCLAAAFPAALADVFPSRIALTNPDGAPFDGSFTDGSAAKVGYLLNDTASAVTVSIVDAASGSVVYSIDAGAQGSGPHEVQWDGSGSVSGRSYTASVTATQQPYSATDYTLFRFINTSESGKNIFTRGVDAQRDPGKKTFGAIYASNSDASLDERLRTGIVRYAADASFDGSDPGDPMLTSTLGVPHTGGVFDYGAISPWYVTLDDQGRMYVSGNGSGQVFRIDSDTSQPKTIIRGLVSPRGLAAVGSGASFALYIADDTTVVRADLGVDDTLQTPPVVVATLGNYVRDVVIDDAGNLFAGIRSGKTGAAPGYIERFSLSGILPVRRSDAFLTSEFLTGQPTGLAIKRGPNRSSSVDDTLYFSLRGAASNDTQTIGIHEMTNIDDPFAVTVKHLWAPDFWPQSVGGNVSTNADLTVDYAGNVVYFENGNEEIIMLSPPSASPRPWVVTGTDTVLVSQGTTGVNEGTVPGRFVLHQNYPNPFNPSTQIAYELPYVADVRIAVYDILGTEVAVLVDGNSEPGRFAAVWNGTNRSGARVASGPYLYRLTATSADGRTATLTGRMLMVK
jgi:flagellar hook assembly protein FlgD